MKIHPSSFEEYQNLIKVSLGREPASLWLKDVHFLNVYTGQIEQGHIYISSRRIAYVGNKEFSIAPETNVVDFNKTFLVVPGYIEPHAHPCQMYNPLTWGEASLNQGTVASVNDNLSLLMLLGPHAIDFIEQLDQLGDHIWLWWHTFDMERANIADSYDTLRTWFKHPLVVQGGEFTAWQAFLKDDPELVRTMFTIKHDFQKRVEGHLPGASIETLNALVAAGIGADHEALDGADIIKRLQIGLYATLRYSSIRPDLPQILDYVAHHPQFNLSRVMLTSDGSAPAFVEQSSCANMIRMVIQSGLPYADAYRMASLNPATYYGLDEDLGGIAPGRLACLNVLHSIDDPEPIHVMQEGKWVIYDRKPVESNGRQEHDRWLQRCFSKRTYTIAVNPESIRQNLDVGIQLINNVITRPYTTSSYDELHSDECFISLIGLDGQWRVHTRIKNFAKGLLGLASTFSASTETIVIGRDKEYMCSALQQVIEMGGGIVALFEGDDQMIIPLPLGGIMSLQSMEVLRASTTAFARKIQSYGYPFEDPIYTLLFLTAIHLPSVRLTRDGIYLVRENRTIRPVNGK